MSRLLIALGLLLAGCATTPFPVALQAGEDSPPFTPQPKELGKIADLWVKSSFKNAETGQSVVFGQVGQCNPMGCRPAIFVENAGKWTQFEFADEKFYHLGWVFVGADQHQTRFWGVLDSQVDAPAWSLRIVLSEDGGKTWKVGPSLRKPYYQSGLHTFEMSANGVGHIEVALDDEAGYGAPTGLYVYESKDWGYSWAPSAFRPNSVWGYREPAGEGLVPFKERLNSGSK